MHDDPDAIRDKIDETMSGLTDKLSKLEFQVLDTFGTVKTSINTVRDSFDLKLQVRQRPWTIVAGASLLGFLGGLHSRRSSNSVQSRPAVGPPRSEPAQVPKSPASSDALSAQGSGPPWMHRLGETFQPEFAQLRGIAVAALIQIARELIANRASDAGAPVQDAPGTRPVPKDSDSEGSEEGV